MTLLRRLRAAGLLTPPALTKLIHDAINKQRGESKKEFFRSDVNAYVRKLREPRFKPHGSRHRVIF